MLKLCDGIYSETGWEGANVSAFKTGEGIILIDSPMLPGDARVWKERITKILDGPIALLINTDYHFDHVMTDSLLCERVLAHTLVEPAFAAQDGEIYAQMAEMYLQDIDQESLDEIRTLRPVSPIITFSESIMLNLGSRRIEVIHMGGHTPATSVVFLPESGIVFTGDIHVHNRHPFPGDGNLLQWMTALERLERLDASKIVPGHGDVCDITSVHRLRQYFEELKGKVKELIEQGYGRREVEERVDLLSYFPVEPGKEERMQAYVSLGAGRMFNQLFESAFKK